MSPADLRAILQQTLADRRLSRTEDRALKAVLEDGATDTARMGVYRSTVFDVAREALAHADHSPAEIVSWLEDVMGALAHVAAPDAAPRSPEACFSPGDACVQRLRGLFQQSQSSADVCVFTITDDRVSEALLEAHHRGVTVRVLTDNDKAYDHGSDIRRLRSAGVATRVDASEYHMHHKFAIFDRRVLVTGSYNWTRSAAEYNEENMLVTFDSGPVSQFQEVFDQLWERCADFAAAPRSRR